jgi:hypothetical protein
LETDSSDGFLIHLMFGNRRDLLSHTPFLPALGKHVFSLDFLIFFPRKQLLWRYVCRRDCQRVFPHVQPPTFVCSLWFFIPPSLRRVTASVRRAFWESLQVDRLSTSEDRQPFLHSSRHLSKIPAVAFPTSLFPPPATLTGIDPAQPTCVIHPSVGAGRFEGRIRVDTSAKRSSSQKHGATIGTVRNTYYLWNSRPQALGAS